METQLLIRLHQRETDSVASPVKGEAHIQIAQSLRVLRATFKCAPTLET